ncbi:MAG: arylsulfotransferase family protein, partial [Solirubrobacteraceae bacterium]
MPGTPDADPSTQISFLGAPASRLRDITVVGSRSGSHTGRLVFYSTHTGGSFLPSHPFVPGEHVTVSATLVGEGTPRKLGTSFTVSSPYTLPSKAAGKQPTPPATSVLRFHSRHDLVPPAVTVTTPAADPTLGDIFVSPDAGPAQAGPMILDTTGRLVWFAPLPWGTTAFNLNVQQYQGKPVLTWWQGHVIGGHGQGIDEIESSHYTPIADVHAGNGLQADLHDFVITPEGTAWLTAFAPQHWDNSAAGGARDGLVDDCVVQEIDIRSGLVMYQWDALGHVPITDTHSLVSRATTSVFDYFHVNSVDPLANGEALISARNTWATYLIDDATGAIVWELGGKQSTFNLAAGVRFAWQHDAELLPDGTVSVFDNEAAPPESTQSRALEVALNTSAHTAT